MPLWGQEAAAVIIPIDLVVAGKRVGQIRTRSVEEGAIYLAREELRQYLSSVVQEGTIDQLSEIPELRGWVLEAGISASTYPQSELPFEYERLVKDIENSSLRLTLGTLGLAVQGFQSGLILEGVSLIRDPNLFRKERVLSRYVSFDTRQATGSGGVLNYQIYDSITSRNILKDLSANPGSQEVLSGSFPDDSGWTTQDQSFVVALPPGQFPPAVPSGSMIPTIRAKSPSRPR
ncbi:MAG: hypothetical protein Kow009_11180 [Spirochaetales bacterium]